jgi:hypothetical protein
MCIRKTSSRTILVTILTLLLCGAPLLFAQTAPPPDTPATADKPSGTDRTSSGEKTSPPGTQYIFVPYDKEAGPKLDLKQSVLLPYAEFLRLKKIVDGKIDTPEFHPVASLVQSSYKGVAKKNVAVLDAEFVIEALARAEDRLEIRLPFAEAAVESAQVSEGKDASLGSLRDGAGVALFVKGGGRRVVQLRIAAPLRTLDAVSRLDFHVPRSAASSLVLKVDANVVLETDSGAVPAEASALKEGGTEIRAACGSRDRIVLAYRPRTEAVEAAARARFTVTEEIRLSVSSGDAHAEVRAAFAVLAGNVESVEVQLPAGVRLLNASGSFVKDWSAGDNRLCKITLMRPLTEAFNIRLDVQFEPAAAPAAAATEAAAPARLTVPEFRIPGAVRETGRIVVVPDEGLSVWPEETTGLEAVPAGVEGVPAARAFRFAQPGWKLVLSKRPVPARVRSDGLLLYEVTDDTVRLKSLHILKVSGRGIFGITFHAPEGYELREAGPPDLVSGFRQQGRDVEVNFRGEQRASCEVSLSFQKGRAGGEIVLEPLAVVGAEEDAGNVVLAMPVALRPKEVASSGLEATDVRGLRARLQPMLGADLDPVLGYRYFAPVFRGAASIERQRTRVTCESARLASVTPSLMRVDTTLGYNVEFSATDTFYILVPASAGEEVHFRGADIKEKFHAKSDSKDPDAPTTWTIRLQRRVIGRYDLGASFDVPLQGAESGKVLKARVPVVRAGGVARETGFVGVSRGENLEVRVPAGQEGLEARDVKELPAELASAFLGFRFFDPAKQKLELELIRHELEGVLGALIRRMHMETVLSDQGDATSEVYFEVQTNREPYLELKLPKEMAIWAAFVRGTPVRPTIRESDGAHLIELAKSDAQGQPFRVRLILYEKMPKLGRVGGLHFFVPEPLNMPVLRATCKLYLPPKYDYVWFGGTMRMELARGKPVRSWVEPAAELLLNDLPASVAGGVSQPALKPRQVSVSPQYSSAETEEEKRARLQVSAIEIPIVRAGQDFEFNRLSGVGDIRVHYWKTKALIVFRGAAFLALFLVILASMIRRKRMAPGWAALIVAILGASLTGGLWGLLFATALTASACALIAGLAFYGFTRLRAVRKP